MLVVDRSVFTQLQADHTGIDFMELSANIIRAHQMQYASTPSILDSEATSKGLSPTSLGFSPPSYDDIFGEKNSDLPPSYSEVSLMFRQFNKINEQEHRSTEALAGFPRFPMLQDSSARTSQYSSHRNINPVTTSTSGESTGNGLLECVVVDNVDNRPTSSDEVLETRFGSRGAIVIDQRNPRDCLLCRSDSALNVNTENFHRKTRTEGDNSPPLLNSCVHASRSCTSVQLVRGRFGEEILRESTL